MRDLLKVQAVVLSSQPVGEFDKRIVLLTREKGKIAAFAKGSRRQGSTMMAATTPFVFGEFTLYEGRSSYTVDHVTIKHQFVDLATMSPGIYYGYYFLEVADYFGHEGTDEKEMMNLLYVSIKALHNQKMDERLIRCLFELRTMHEQGMTPRLWDCGGCSKEVGEGEGAFFSQNAHGLICASCARRYRGSGQTPRAELTPISDLTLAAMRYSVRAPLSRLFAFSLPEETLRELEGFAHPYLIKNVDKKLKSLEILKTMIG